MKPVEPDYGKECENKSLSEFAPEEKCPALMRRGTRRCHRIARQYLLGRALDDYIREELERNSSAINEYISKMATSLSLIEVGAYSYSVEGYNMFISIAKGFVSTWRYEGLQHDYSSETIMVGDEKVEYRAKISVRFYDAIMREWFVEFKIYPGLMTYRQYQIWIPIYRKWQDRALAAVGAATL
jgi:hypothetical protein